VVRGVISLSSGALLTRAEAIDVLNGMGRCGVLLDVVNGGLEMLYRRHSADWLRVIPLDEDDEDNIERCAGYEIKVEPIASLSLILFHSGARLTRFRPQPSVPPVSRSHSRHVVANNPWLGPALRRTRATAGAAQQPRP
jgi:hypothetical protein